MPSERGGARQGGGPSPQLAPVDTHGFVITTSEFTKQARTEAVEPGLKPIALINGTALVELLVDLGIGVEKRQVEVIRFDPSKVDEDLAK